MESNPQQHDDIELGRASRHWDQRGMKQIRLLVWKVFRDLPLDQQITEQHERLVAAQCGASWDTYLAWKSLYPEYWIRGAQKREVAKIEGWKPQPPQLRRYREKAAKKRSRAEVAMFNAAPGARGLNRELKRINFMFHLQHQIDSGSMPNPQQLAPWREFQSWRRAKDPLGA